MLVKGRGIDEILRPFELFIDIFEYLLGVYLGLDLLGSEDFLDDAFFVNEIGGTEDSDGLSAAGCLLAPAAEFLQ